MTRTIITGFFISLFIAGTFFSCASQPKDISPTEEDSRTIGAATDMDQAQDQATATEPDQSEVGFWEEGPLPDSFRRPLSSQLIDVMVAQQGATQGSTQADQPIDTEKWAVFQALAQFHKMQLSYDYFGQFTTGDMIFEDYLISIYGLEEGPFYPGRGIEMSIYDGEGNVQVRYQRVMLEDSDSGRWWQVRHSQREEILYELFTGPYGVPREVRFLPPGSELGRGPGSEPGQPSRGKAESRETMLGQSVAEAESQLSPEQITQALSEDRFRELRSDIPQIPEMYGGLEKQTSETIELGGRKVYAYRFSGQLTGSQPGTVNVWISPDIPGRIARISMNEITIAEITGWIDSAERFISEEQLEAGAQNSAAGSRESTAGDQGSRPARSEGSPSQPVEIVPGTPQRGIVAGGGISYYRLVVNKRSDLQIRLNGMRGSAALYNYGSDESFTDWRNSSEGYEPSITEYYAEPDTVLYFSVEATDNSGAEYSVVAEESTLLDPLGVRMYAPYVEQSELLSRGTATEIESAAGDLQFFAVETGDNQSMELQVSNLHPELIDFRFLDVLGGSYSQAGGSSTGSGSKVIRLDGLGENSTVYFYLTSAPDSGTRTITVSVK